MQLWSNRFVLDIVSFRYEMTLERLFPLQIFSVTSICLKKVLVTPFSLSFLFDYELVWCQTLNKCFLINEWKHSHNLAHRKIHSKFVSERDADSKDDKFLWMTVKYDVNDRFNSLSFMWLWEKRMKRIQEVVLILFSNTFAST
jgi:hypothetical protein